MDGFQLLEGRIVAIELMLQGFMASYATESDANDPVKFLDGWQSAMRASLQNPSRPAGDYADETWGVAAESLEILFSNVRKRLGASP